MLSACGVPFGVYHTVEKGQTLYNIAKVYGVPMADISRANDLDDTSELMPGQRLFIPGATHTMYVPPSVETGSSQQSPGPGGGQPQQAKTYRQRSAQTITDSGTPSFHFIWPLHGTVLQGFSTSNGARHDGIDIQAPEGTPVRAAASGTVIYSDDTIRGYGNMIIIKHKNGFVTVYAHDSVNLVRKGQAVEQGQVIAKVGHTGYATGPHLHFEIRIHAIPRNPLDYLPQ